MNFMLKVNTRRLLLLAKISLVVLAFWYLLHNNDINFAALNLLLDDAVFLAALCAVIAVGMGFVVVVRWWILLKAIGLNIPLLRLYNIAWIGQFFSVFLPGAISADAVKAIYVIKMSDTHGQALPLTSVLMDKVIGLFSIVCIALVSLLTHIQLLSNNAILVSLTISVGILFVAMLLFFGLLFWRWREGKDLFIKLLKKMPFSEISTKLLLSARLYSDKKTTLVYALLLSLCVQLQLVLVYFYIAEQLNEAHTPLWSFFFIVPLGELTTAIPIAPAGIGVGHLAFNSLFELMGQHGGADVFNLFTVARLGIACLGAVPFIFYKYMKHVQPKIH